MCTTEFGTCRCSIPTAAVIIVLILNSLIFYASVAELKSPINNAPLPLAAG